MCKSLKNALHAIETSVQFLEKEIDNVEVPDVTEIKTDIATIIADLQSLNSNLEKLETKLEKKDSNPLNG
jgi:rubrerythrin